MKPVFSHVIRDHVILGAFASLSMLPFYGGIGCCLFFLANILIDLDHYAHFLWVTRFRYWDIVSMFRFFEAHFLFRNRPEYLSMEALHTVEISVLITVATFYWGGVLSPIFAGLLFHAIVDVIQIVLLKVFTRRCHSLVEYFWRSRNMRRQGLDPVLIDQEALEAAGLVPADVGRAIR